TGYTWTPEMHMGDTSVFHVPASASCNVSTTSRPSILNPLVWTWYGNTTYSQTNPFTVAAPVTNIATHYIRSVDTRTITVNKTVTGTVGGTGIFTVRVDCGGAYAKTMNLAHNGSDTLQAPLGSTCSVTEDNPGAGVIGNGNTNTAVIYPSDFIVDGNQTVQVSNRITGGTFPKGTLIVTKTISGEPAHVTAGHNPANLFGITVACTSTPQADVWLKEGQSATVEGKVEERCVINEAVIPATLDPNYQYVWGISPMETTLRVAGDEIDVTVDNKVIPAGITTHGVSLTNAVTGPIPTAYDLLGGFVLELNCGTNFTWTTGPMRAGDKAGYSVPDDTNCTENVVSRPLADASFVWRDDLTDYAPSRSFRVINQVEGVVTHSLQRESEELVQIFKTLTGDATLYQSGTFNVTLTCTDGTNMTFLFVPPLPKTENVMVSRGAQCTVTEDTSNVVLSSGTPRRIIAPYLFTVPAGGQTVIVETELLLDPSLMMAGLTVTKQITGLLAGHRPAAVFGITVSCPGTSSALKTLNLLGGQSAWVDAEIGDTCVIEEPTVPDALNWQYKYAPTTTQSLLILAGGRSATVINEVILVSTGTVTFTFAQATVTDIAGSGYVSGLLNTTVNCGAGRVYSLSLAEGDTKTVTVPTGTRCTAASAGALPPLNSGFRYNGPTTNPALPFTVPLPTSANGIVTINYGIQKIDANLPIPTLDLKALLLLIGLLTGFVFWQSRRRRA
ncbi:MAG: DUF5979 domain-containing protein, partial [Proteobacteria bacterium]|nr:DUF5979 domain-containing protein [Pseudomonadota bacterium]